MTYEQVKAKRRANRNPWLTLAIDRIAERGAAWRSEFILTLTEYDGHDQPEAVCPHCGGEMWYRGSVGTIICTSCHTLRTRDGNYVGGGS